MTYLLIILVANVLISNDSIYKKYMITISKNLYANSILYLNSLKGFFFFFFEYKFSKS